MGTDGKWITIRTLDVLFGKEGEDHWPEAPERNYERFAALAGVRGDGPAPRRLPKDLSDTALWRCERDGGHSPSWLPLDEATRIFATT